METADTVQMRAPVLSPVTLWCLPHDSAGMCAHTHTPQATLEGSTPLGEEEQKRKKDGTTEEEASPREVVNFTRKRFFSPLSLSRFSIVSDAAAVGHFGLFSHFDPSTTRSDQHKNGSDVAAASRPALVEGGNENAQLKLVRWLQADPCYSILFCSFFYIYRSDSSASRRGKWEKPANIAQWHTVKTMEHGRRKKKKTSRKVSKIALGGDCRHRRCRRHLLQVGTRSLFASHHLRANGTWPLSCSTHTHTDTRQHNKRIDARSLAWLLKLEESSRVEEKRWDCFSHFHRDERPLIPTALEFPFKRWLEKEQIENEDAINWIGIGESSN